MAAALILAAAAPPTAPADPPAATAPAAASRPAASKPATTAAAATLPAGAKITLNFKDAPLDSVIDFLSQSAGFAIIKDGPVEGRVTIVSRQSVSAEEALTLVNAALRVNGFTLIREGRLLRIAAREKAKKGNVPVHFGGKPEDVADTDEIITQVIPIVNVSAVKLRDDLKPLIGPDADVAANDGSNAIIITDSSASVRRIVRIIAGLDQHEAAASDVRIVKLKFANAAAAVKLVDTFFKGGGSAMSPEMMMRMQQQGMQMPPQRGGSDKHGPGVVAAADDRTNTLIVMGPPPALKLIDDILKHLDSNPEPASVMRSFPLKFANAEQTAKLVDNLFKSSRGQSDDMPFYYRRFGGGGDDDAKKDVKVTAAFDERTNTLIVTAPEVALKAVEDMVKTLDAAPMASGDIKVFQLKYADAFTVSKLIEDMFKPKDDGGGRFPFFFFSDSAPPQQGKGPKVTVTSDDRTNSLIVGAPVELLKRIETIVHQLDANPATEDTLFIYHLRNAQATNLEYVLNVLFGNVSGAGQNGQNPNGDPNQQQQQQQQQGRNPSRFGANTGSNGTGVGTPDSRTSGSRRNNRLNQGGSPRLSPGMAKAINELTGRVFVVADADTNALLVTTASKYEKQVRLIIDDLDRPVPQVLIKVLVAEVTHDNSADLGVDFSVLNTRPGGNGQTGGTNFGNAALKGGLVVSVVETNVTATLHALAQQNKLDVLSRPYLLASDNQLANILIGQSVPFITDTRITDSGQQINSVQYRDIGLSLNVTPHINPDGMVILDVTPEISQLTSQSIPISSTVSAPVIAKRSAESRIAVNDGQTIVIGGLMEDRKTSAVDKVPLLGDLPYVGWLFGRARTTTTKTELLIFLTPHVAQRPDALQPVADDEVRGTKLVPNAVEPGTFDDHMNGLRRGNAPQSRPATAVSPVNSIDLSSGPKTPLPAPADSREEEHEHD